VLQSHFFEETCSSHDAAAAGVVVEAGHFVPFPHSLVLLAPQGDAEHEESEELQGPASTQAQVEEAIHILQKGAYGSHEDQAACAAA